MSSNATIMSSFSQSNAKLMATALLFEYIVYAVFSMIDAYKNESPEYIYVNEKMAEELKKKAEKNKQEKSARNAKAKQENEAKKAAKANDKDKNKKNKKGKNEESRQNLKSDHSCIIKCSRLSTSLPI